MNVINSYGIVPSIIDAAGFYVGNYGVHKLAPSIPKANAMHTIIFGISDLIVRNGMVTMWKANTFFNGEVGRNAYIGVIATVFNTIADVVKDKELGNALTNNLINAAVGVATNSILDKFVVPESYA